MRQRTILLMVIMAVALEATEAPGCTCRAPLPAPKVALERADAVFIGTVTEIKPSPLRGYLLDIRVEIDRVWKGTVNPTMIVNTANNEGACGYTFTKGKSYLIYAGYTELPEGLRLGTSLCSRTRPLENAAEDLAELGPGKAVATLGEEPEPLLGPIAHWAFEEGRGSTAYDWAGNNHGTIHGAKWTTGKLGRALSFDGKDDYVSIMDARDPVAYTITAWVNAHSVSAQGIIVRTSPRGPAREWSHQLLISSSGKFVHYLYCADGTALAVTSDRPIVIDTWYHVAAVAENNGDMRLYVNGEEQGTAQRIGWLWRGGDRWYIASNASGLGYFNGVIDEVAIYNRALSAKEIRRLYQQRTSGLVAHWKFDEGSGTVAHDSIGNNHGTIHGAKWTTGKVGRALSFDGADDYVDCGNDPLFDITGPITLAAWVKTSSGSSVWQGIVTKGEVLWKIQKHISGSGDFECWGLIGAPPPGPYLSTVGVNMNDGQWHHIAGTYDGAAMRIYWDGVLNNSLSVSGTINTGSEPVYIGGVYGKPEYGFPGIIDEVAIYNRALSAEEIRQLYEHGSPDQVKQSPRKPAEPSAWLVTMTPLGVMFEFRPTAGSSGWTDMELYEHGGEMLAAFSCPHTGEPIQIWLAEPVDQNEPAKYYLRYRIRITAAPLPKWRVIGLSRMPRTTNKTSDEEYAAIVQAIKDVLPAFPRCPVGEPNLPMPHEVLISYSKRSRIPMAKIEAVMVDLVRKHWQPQGSDPHSISQQRLVIRVIAVLGELRTSKALPVLNQVVESDNQDIRVTATRAIIKIGGENLLPFVRHVFCERKRFSWYECFLMYEQLSPYIGLQTWRPALLEDKESFKVDEDLRVAVLQFLINAVYADITPSGNTRRLDQMLCLVNEDYKFSYERENILERLEQAWTKSKRDPASGWARAYPTDHLKILRAVPAEKRTHVEIHEIKSDTWPLIVEKSADPSATKVKDGSSKKKNLSATRVPQDPKLVVDIALSHGPMKDGLAAFLLCHRSRFKVGEPIPVMYGVIYARPGKYMTIRRPWAIAQPNSLSWFSITGPDGKDVPWVGGNFRAPAYAPEYEVSLRRGEFHGRLWHDILWRHKISMPGTYTAKWHYKIAAGGGSWWQGHLVSNEIKIEIVP